MGSSGRDPHQGTHLPGVIVLLRAVGGPGRPCPSAATPAPHGSHLPTAATSSPKCLRRQSEGGAGPTHHPPPTTLHPPTPSQALGELCSVSMGFRAGESGGQGPASCPAPVTSSDPPQHPQPWKAKGADPLQPGMGGPSGGSCARGRRIPAQCGERRWKVEGLEQPGRCWARGDAACTLGAAGMTPRPLSRLNSNPEAFNKQTPHLECKYESFKLKNK